MKIGIICAMKIEADTLKASLNGRTEKICSGITFSEGRIGDCDVSVCVCGIGKVNAAMCTEAMILCCAPDAIINTGVAGGLGHGICLGDLIVASDLLQHDMDTSPIGDPVGFISGINRIRIPADETLAADIAAAAEHIGKNTRRGVIATGDRFIASDGDRERIRGTFGADVCEMEGGAVAQVCFVNGIPFAILRAISDSGDGDAAQDYASFARQAADNAAEILLEYLKNR